MVIDEVDDRRFPRFLVYDIIRYEGNEVGKTVFSTRLHCIDKEIVQTRARYIQEVSLTHVYDRFFFNNTALFL